MYTKIKYDHTTIDGVNLSAGAFCPAAPGASGEYHVLASVTDPRMGECEMLAAIKKYLAAKAPQAAVVFSRTFFGHEGPAALAQHAGHAACRVYQPPVDGTLAGVWAYAIDCPGKIAGDVHQVMVERNGYRHIWSADLPAASSGSYAECTEMLRSYAAKLNQLGGSLLGNCLRTWFMVRDIDHRYQGMVKGRNEVFADEGLTRSTHFIASTGIGGDSLHDKRDLVLDAYAVLGIDPAQIRYIKAADNFNNTMDYGVAFERATAVDYGDRRHLFISGTASINNAGEIMYPGDVARQTARMLDNIAALVHEGGMEMSDLTHLLVYLRYPADYGKVKAVLAHHYPTLPAIYLHAPVCRPGWLVEAEGMAISSMANPRFAAY